MMVSSPKGANLSFKQLVDALLYKCKYEKQQLLELSDSHLDSLNRKLQIAASAVRGCRNALRPINSLPFELLTIIFSNMQPNLSSFLPDSDKYDVHGRDWFTLLRVCRHWRGVIAKSPILWSSVDNKHISSDYLRRSRAAPLKVYFGVKDYSKITRKSMDILLPHVSRLHEFHLEADDWDDPTPIYQLFTSPAPRLMSLSIETEGKDIIGGALPPIFNGEMPLLKQLTLGYFTSWPTGYFRNLTHLCLDDQHEFSLPTTATFLDFLAESPMLESLALVRAGPTLSDASDVPPPPGRMVSLSKLRQFSIGEWPALSYISRLLSHIQLPAETDLYIWGPVLTFSDENLRSIYPEDTSNLANVRGITEWYMTHYTIAQPEYQLYQPFNAVVGSTHALHTYGVCYPNRLLESLERFSMTNIETFVLRDFLHQSHRFSTSVWTEIFGLLVNLKSLRILAYYSTSTTRSVLTALYPDTSRDESRTDKLEEGAQSREPRPENMPTLLCPKLSSLGIKHEDIATISITKLVKERKRLGSPIESLTVLIYPNYGMGAPSVSETTSSRYGVEDEYDLRAKEELELLEQYVKEVKFEYDDPLSLDYVPQGWPTDAYQSRSLSSFS